MPREEAQYAARREFGNVTLIERDGRVPWRFAALEDLAMDLSYAWRTLRKGPGFATVAILTLALGIGANTAIFSFMDAVLLRLLPVPDAKSLVWLNWRADRTTRDFVMHGMSGTTYDEGTSGESGGILPYPAFEMFQKDDAIFSSVFGFYPSWLARHLNVTIRGKTDVAAGIYVSGDYFRGLGVLPAAGRLLTTEDDRAGGNPVVVISYGYSQRQFGGAGNAAGQSILIDNVPFMVAGVVPAGFFGADTAASSDLYLPMHANEVLGAGKPFGFTADSYLDGNYYWVQVMARLRPGVSLEQAQATLAPQFKRWVESTAKNDAERANLPVLVVKAGAGGLDTLRRRYSQPLFVLMALVGLILALACANVANLLLARATSRRREIALRLSLGAGRSRMVRQLLTESLLLSSLGGVLGVLFAFWGIRLLALLLGNGQAGFPVQAGLNWHVLGVATALSLLTGAAFGLIPALQATRVDVLPALKETRAGASPVNQRLGRASMTQALVVCQVGISVLLLVAAGLFVRTLASLKSIELGFNREGVLLFQLDARKAGHKDPEICAFYGELRNRLSTIPGVNSASLSEDSLIEAGTGFPVRVPGVPPNPANRLLRVGPDFFKTMEIPILQGRDIHESDRVGTTSIVVINEAFAKANFAGRNPLGQHFSLLRAEEKAQVARDMEVVGVAKDARYGGLRRSIPPVAFIPYNQGYPEPEQMVYALRTAGDPLQYVSSVREIVRQADPRVAVTEVRTQRFDVDRTMTQEVTFAQLCSAFALLALVIACIGLYGSVSYSVSRRTGEIGIRMALGAQRRDVLRMVLQQVLIAAGLGLAVGFAAALGTTRFVASLLYGIKPNDPLALFAAGASVLGAALLGGYAPARKASRIDPLLALRHE